MFWVQLVQFACCKAVSVSRGGIWMVTFFPFGLKTLRLLFSLSFLWQLVSVSTPKGVLRPETY